jgi:hypothetical protein
MEYLPLIVSFISGGLAGAVVNLLVTKRRQRVDSALRVIDYYFAIYNEIGEAKRILQNPSLLSDANEEIRVRKIGDWFELVSSLCNKKVVDTEILAQVALFGEMDVFRSLVEGSFTQSRVLHDAKKWWPELYDSNLKKLGG